MCTLLLSASGLDAWSFMPVERTKTPLGLRALLWLRPLSDDTDLNAHTTVSPAEKNVKVAAFATSGAVDVDEG